MNNIKIKVDYICQTPKIGGTPKVSITGDTDKEYLVCFHDANTTEMIFSGICKTNQTIVGNRQWFTNWIISVYDENMNTVFVDKYNPSGKVVFIKTDSYALGDNIAWVPYFEEFRLKHNCTVICSTFFNHLFESEYPNILFVEPNTRIGNVYAQYYVGASDFDNKCYSKSMYKHIELQKVPCEILGLDYVEIKPNVRCLNSKIKNNKIICISEYASAKNKMWSYENGWQKVVDYLNGKGFEVHVISKEPTELKNIVDLTGNYSLDDRITQLKECKLFIGVSSGLAWLSWAVDTHVMMISDISPSWHEFQSNITRLTNNTKGFVDYDYVEPTLLSDVLNKLDILLQ